MTTHHKIGQAREARKQQNTIGRRLQNHVPAINQNSREQLHSDIKTIHKHYANNLSMLMDPKTYKAIDEGQPADALGLYFTLKNLQTELTQLAEEINSAAFDTEIAFHSKETTRIPRILLKADEAFSFDVFLKNGRTPSDREDQKKIYRQCQIIHALMRELFLVVKNTNTSLELKYILREKTDHEDKGSFNSAYSLQKRFSIDHRLSNRIEGEIDTFAFQLCFISRTETFRAFLNQLATSPLPLIVSAVEIKRAKSKQRLRPSVSFAQKNNAPSYATNIVKDKDSLMPVITDTLSEFTLTIERVTLVSEGHRNLAQTLLQERSAD